MMPSQGMHLMRPKKSHYSLSLSIARAHTHTHTELVLAARSIVFLVCLNILAKINMRYFRNKTKLGRIIII